MTNESEHTSKYLYKHKDAAEMQAFIFKMKSKARTKDENAGKIAKAAMTANITTIESSKAGLGADEFKKANSILYDIILEHIGNESLILSLGTKYDEMGAQALIYIRGCFASGGNEDKEKVAWGKYNSKIAGVKPGTTSSELRDTFNVLHGIRLDLHGTDREVSDAHYCADIKDAVSKLSAEHRTEVRDAVRQLTGTERTKPDRVESALEGVVGALRAEEEEARENSQRRALSVKQADEEGHNHSSNGNADANQLMQLLLGMAPALVAATTNPRNNNTLIPRCDQCGVRHPMKPGEECHAQLLSEGKEVPGWDKKPADMQKRLQDRAQEIREKGPYKSRSDSGGRGTGRGGRGGGTGGSGNVSPASAALLTALLAQGLKGAGAMSMPTVLPSTMQRVHAVVSKYGDGASTRIIVDSGNLSGMHLFGNKELFSSLNPSVKLSPITVADNHSCEAEGYGCSDVLAFTDDGVPQLLLHLDHCAYIPSFGCEVNLLSIQAAKAKGVSFTFNDDGNVIHFPNGTCITFGDDMT